MLQRNWTATYTGGETHGGVRFATQGERAYEGEEILRSRVDSHRNKTHPEDNTERQRLFHHHRSADTKPKATRNQQGRNSMKRLEFESASQAINHLKKLGGKRVEWTRITTGWHGSRRAAGRFVTRRRSFNNGFQTYPIGNVRV